MDIILIAGLWLRRSIWAHVATELEQLGHRPIPLALPGVDDASTGATLADQVTTAVAAVDAAERPVVVGHSAACTLAWIAADQRPDTVARVGLVGDSLRRLETSISTFSRPSVAPLRSPGGVRSKARTVRTSAQRNENASRPEPVPVPEGVSNGIVELSDDRRFDVPVIVVCPEFSPDQALADG